jgi:hypothetical protein
MKDDSTHSVGKAQLADDISGRRKVGKLGNAPHQGNPQQRQSDIDNSDAQSTKQAVDTISPSLSKDTTPIRINKDSAKRVALVLETAYGADADESLLRSSIPYRIKQTIPDGQPLTAVEAAVLTQFAEIAGRPALDHSGSIFEWVDS